MNWCIACLLLLSLSARADWVQTGLAGGPAQSLYADGSFLLVKCPHGFFRSFDHGKTWAFGAAPFDATTLAGVGSVLFAATINNGGQGIWSSRDSARTWSLVVPVQSPGSGSLPGFVKSLYAYGPYLFAGGDTSIFRSADLGATWTRAPISGGPVSDIQCFGASGALLFAGAYGAVFRSADSGATWRKTGVFPGPGPNWIGSIAGDGQVVIAMGLGGFRSTDQGATWSLLPNFHGDESFQALALQGSDFIAAVHPVNSYSDADSVYRSTDQGRSWMVVGLLENALTTGFSVEGDSIWIGTDIGPYFSADGGGTWTRLPVPAATVGALSASNGFVFAPVAGEPYLYSTSDQGKDWVPTLGWKMTDGDRVPGPEGGFSVAGKGSDLFAVNSLSADLRRSRDGTVTWEPVHINGTIKRVWGVGAEIYANAYIDTGSGLYRMGGSGAAWTRVTRMAPGPFLVGSGSAFFSVKSAVIYKHADADTGWLPCSPDLGQIFSLAAAETNLFAATPKGLYRSTDTGRTWKPIHPDLSHFAALCAAGSVLIAGGPTQVSADGSGRAPRLLYSSDAGATWTPAGEGLIPVDITSLSVSGSDVYAGTDGGGVWRRPLAEIGAVAALHPGRDSRGDLAGARKAQPMSGLRAFEATGRRADRKGSHPSRTGVYLFAPSGTGR